jgi:hypothetical protein
MGVRICMGIEGLISVSKSSCGSRKAWVSQESAWESKGTCEAGIKGLKNGGKNPRGNQGSQECKWESM